VANNRAFLGLGSNLGNRENNILNAIHLLAGQAMINIEKISSLYETQPVGFLEQPYFLNAALWITTSLSPEKLLEVCLCIEKRLGRTREIHWGPRYIDIDILVYGEVEMATKLLTLPHPYMHKRKFVLVPLHEIAPNVPIYKGLTAGQVLESMSDDSNIVRLLKKR
jgi:2-amino-4-hydroxy-6-hydroxymethyldihydropteridine diphosphokinase